MKSTSQWNQRLKLYQYSDKGSGTGIVQPYYVLATVVLGMLAQVSARLQMGALQATEVAQAMMTTWKNAPVIKGGVVADEEYPDILYLVTGVVYLHLQDRIQASLTQVDRGQYPLSDATVATLSPSPASVSIAHGTGNALGASTITPLDAYGYSPTDQLLYSVAKTAGSSSATALMRGNLLDIHNVPSSPASGDQFTVSCGVATPVVIPVTFT